MAKHKPLKLPKHIAGVKVPKFLREPGTVEQLLDNPVGRAVLAEALIAAAAALKNYQPPADASSGGSEAAAAGSDAAGAAKDAVQSVASGLGASGLADVAVGVVRQIVPASTAGDEGDADKPARRPRTKTDKPGETSSQH